MLSVRRSQGAGSGVLLVLLGLWGALIPYVGPYFHYAYTPDRAWAATAGRVWLELLPGIVTLLGGVVMLLTRSRLVVLAGACLATLAGIWFAAGPLVSAHWPALPAAGSPAGPGSARMLAEQLGFFTGLGIVIAFVAALAIGRITVIVPRADDDSWDELPEPEAAPARMPAPEPVPVPTPEATTRTIRQIVPVPAFRPRNREPDQASGWAGRQ